METWWRHFYRLLLSFTHFEYIFRDSNQLKVIQDKIIFPTIYNMIGFVKKSFFAKIWWNDDVTFTDFYCHLLTLGTFLEIFVSKKVVQNWIIFQMIYNMMGFRKKISFVKKCWHQLSRDSWQVSPSKILIYRWWRTSVPSFMILSRFARLFS